MIGPLLPTYVFLRRAAKSGALALALDVAVFAYAGYLLLSRSPLLVALAAPYVIAPLLVSRGPLRVYSGLASALGLLGVLLMAQPQLYYQAIGFAIAVSSPGAVLVATPDKGSLEGLFRYFVVSTVASSLVVAGLSGGGPLGSVFVFSGIALELGAFPAFFWVPDVFSRASPEGLVLLSSLTKLGAALALSLLSFDVPPYVTVPLAAATMLVGNLGATTSREPGRLLGYASVYHAGLAIAAYALYKPLAPFLMFADAVGMMGLFSYLASPGPKWTAYALALNQVGVPPLVGFWPKLALFVLAARANLPLAIYVLGNVAWSIVYYVRLASSLEGGRRALAVAPSLFALALGLAAPLWLLPPFSLLLHH
ncbi:proton-conducting transporter membrane subunit [Thermoproteus tenax]|uniref:Ferredoxin:quinone oxidoreductase, complex I, subunit N n=1 Tax=Thermoproteus tenax (strain ATCC 35583 / DSM 2078 / JCM 9277 / NBRC 100435 / Kra 1) TaxID=768679 RepID=G4RMU2_THETK|nr:proton-conducting transporter membrane subunit [Thermoproteus tenax]CCC80886.1 ferredoxin:quinone oxidoreductase, complex I, subunit N [Thermoproteus tenax Kra 1]